jgi:N-acetylmuramoyl-L-alanine amidase
LTVKEILLNDTEISTEMQQVIKSTNDSPSTRAMSDTVAAKARARGIPESEVKTILDRITKIEVVINNVDTTLSGTIPKTNADYFLREKKLTNLVNKFEYVDSIEELSGEFRTLSRSVTECIIHASDTFTNQNIGSNEIDAVHKEDGYDGIQFHYVIRRDGRIQRGKPVNDKSLASNINGHENYTIDICLIGGINAPSGTENAGDLLSDKSYTIKQWQSLKLFLWAFYTRFPGGIVMGYGDIDASSNEPYFDVIEYVREGFGKVNPYDNTYSDTPLDGSNLIKKRVEIF